MESITLLGRISVAARATIGCLFLAVAVAAICYAIQPGGPLGPWPLGLLLIFMIVNIALHVLVEIGKFCFRFATEMGLLEIIDSWPWRRRYFR